MASFIIKLDADNSALDRKVENAERKLNRVNQKAGGLGGGSSFADAGFTSGGGGSGSGFGGLSNPWERQIRANERLQVAQDWGFSGGQLSSLQLEKARADAQVARADRVISGTTMQGKVMDALMTSRIGAGGMMPLVNRLAAVVGTGGMMAAAGLAGAAQMYGAGMASSADLGYAFWAGGGSVGETGQVSAIGRFLGRSATESAGAAVSFGDALHSSTFGAGWMRSRGIVDQGGLTVDKDTNYIAAVKALTSEPDRGVATRVARDVGLTSELWMRDLSKDQRATLFGGMSEDMSKEGRASEAQYQFTKARVSSAWDREVRNFAQHPLNWSNFSATSGGEIDNGWLENAMKEGAEKMLSLPPGTLDRAQRWLIDKYGDADDKQWLKDHTPGGDDDGPSMSTSGAVASKFNVRTQAGIVGGGPRVNAALPARVRGQQFSENADAYGQYTAGYLS